MMIQRALKWAPKTTRNVARSHSRGPRRLPPKIISPRKPPSRKNAKTPSAASRLPKTLPTNREYSAQLVPNSNSWTTPVATPMAKISA